MGTKSTSSFSEMALPLFETLGGSGISQPLQPGEKLPSYISDHRQRLRRRFLDGGPDALPDYEMLELVLFRAIPHKDVKPLAHALLQRFGDFN